MDGNYRKIAFSPTMLTLRSLQSLRLRLWLFQVLDQLLIDRNRPVLFSQPPIESLAGRDDNSRFAPLRFQHGSYAFPAIDIVADRATWPLALYASGSRFLHFAVHALHGRF